MDDRRKGTARRAIRLALGVALVTATLFPADLRAADAGPPSGAALEHWTSKNLPPGLPFSEAVQVGDLVFLSGQIGILPGTRTLAPGGIQEEARQTMENIRATLASRGYGLDRLVRCTVMLADMSEWATFNEVYRTFFSGSFPARSAFGANGLALDARVEVECVAAVPPAGESPVASAAPVSSAPPQASAPPQSSAPPASSAPPVASAPPAASAPPVQAPPVEVRAPEAAAPMPAAIPASASPLAGPGWRLVEIGGAAPLRGAEATLVLGDDGRVSGEGPCNGFSGKAEIDGDRIRLGPLAATKRACSNGAVNALESDYFAALARSARFVREGDRLTLFDAGGGALLRFAAGAP